MTAIQGVYGGLRPVKTRKIWVLEIEIPEEQIKEVTNVMGFPNQSESQWVGVTLMNPPVIPDSSTVVKSATVEKTEGEKLVTRAGILCKQADFQNFCMRNLQYGFEYGSPEQRGSAAKLSIYTYCDIKSRKELATNKEAQIKFQILLGEFSNWKFEQNYSDNFSKADLTGY